MHDPAHNPPARTARHAGWRRLSEALLRTALIALLVGITVLAGAASQSQWSVQDVPWLREVTTHVGTTDPAVAAASARPVPSNVALPATLRGPEAPDGMPMSAALDGSRSYAAIDADDEDGERMLD
ncbi:hypothetical protein [Stenotrophomonas sp. MMGLT7]|uniref:hypothetical protein n=1 Tax=Stenotrophomonas sp. MMGLT7 TaxID=2901227 RepID=UPI001E5E63B2|nr:hypothetical protein [Stenotrophomonas sp. MMGLT7]MCD7098032.1 hypothetical protein [Stenotrophomonas sp. MMGLT7]